MRYPGFISLLFILLVGCAKSEVPIGERTAEWRYFEEEFDALYVGNGVNVSARGLVNDSASTQIFAYPGDHKNVHTEISGNTLWIDSEEGVFPNMGRRLSLYPINLRRFNCFGNSDVSLVDMNFSNLSFSIGGSGLVSISGEANSIEGVYSGENLVNLSGVGSVLSVNHQGEGDFYARYYQVESCKVEINGPGDAYVNVLTNMTVIFNGTGNVYYTGPVTQIVAIYNGSGELIRLPD